MIPSQVETRTSMELLSNTDIPPVALKVYISRVALVITTAAFVYDHLITVNDEVELIWPSRFSFVKILYFLNRYLPFVGLVGLCHVFVSFDVSNRSQHCLPAFWIFGSFIYVSFCISEYVLYTRLYAIWGGSSQKVPLCLFLMGCLILWSPAIYFGAKFEISATVGHLPVFPTGCLILPNGHFELLAMINLLVSEIVAVLGMLIKASQFPDSVIMKRISDDGVLFFAVSLAATIANMIVLGTAQSYICDLLLPPQAALHSICAGRLLIRIRKAVAHTEVLNDTLDLSSPRELSVSGSQVHDIAFETRSVQLQE